MAAMFGPKYWRATWFCCLIAIFNQFSGCNAVTIYSTTLFLKLDVSATVGSIIVGVSQVIGCLLGGVLMRCGFGYKTLMVAAELVMGTLLFLTAFFAKNQLNNLLIVTIALFLIAYQALMGNLFWPYAGALLTETGLSLASMAIWGCVLLMSICTQMMFDGLGVSGTFFFFTGCTFLGLFVFLFLMKETKGVDKDELPLLYLPKGVKD